MAAIEEEAPPSVAIETEREAKEPIPDLISKDESMLGCYVEKKDDEARGLLLGKIASYNPDSNLYCVVYEDGEREDMDRVQLCNILISEDDASSSRLKMSCRKRKLDLLLSEDANKNRSDVSDNVDSSSNSCESAAEKKLEIHIPDLPPSSVDFAVPDESIGHLFSVYNFLRSFSAQLFLSPFTLNDFVSSLICRVQNSLLDAVYLSLMKALRRHLEALSSDGSKLASKCLRYHDWTLLDTLTWPIFLLEFLHVMGYLKQLGGQKFGINLFTTEYYLLPISQKLKILQILCDEVVDSSDLKTELEKREEYSEDAEEYSCDTPEPTPRRGRPKKQDLNILSTPPPGPHELGPPKKEGSHEPGLDIGQDGNSNECRICNMDGMLICCDGCPWAYHSRCIGLNKLSLPEGLWFCPECSIDKTGPTQKRVERGARGARFFGVDVSGRQFIGICDYLLVTGILPDAEPYQRYYNKSDVQKVLYQLSSKDETWSFVEICKGISEYWDNKLPKFDNPETSRGNTVIFPMKDENKNGFVACSTIPQNTLARTPNIRGPNVKNPMKPAQPIFRPHLYQNLYFHGEISASSAATHAVLSAEEGNNSKSVNNSNPRKNITLNNMTLLQMKAFASAALQFVWPSFDRRQTEVPRDRCGWCIPCKAASTNKKGCLLNLAASNATKAFARNLSGLRPMNRHEETHLPSIANYLANMEENLQGLMEGPLIDPQFRQWWRDKLKKANDCRSLKFLLLQMEKCIRGVAMSNVWFKLIDVDVSGTSAGGGNQRRGGNNGGKRKGKKAMETASSSSSGISDDSWKEHQWWRGGRLSSALLQRLSLSRYFIRIAARQGGLKKISGVSYHDVSEYARINRQSAWRSCVETSKSTSHLALQVRYLNAHIRWRELLPPDQIPTDVKFAEADAAIFRNAVICDKNKKENKTIYALKFKNQKHLPVRVTKNVVETENPEDENLTKLWFYENHVPLYLIKMYEEKVMVKVLGNNNNNNNNNVVVNNYFPDYERKLAKMYYDKHIFEYLNERLERPLKPPCAACTQEVFLRDAIKCANCQGLCHNMCMLLSGGDVMCKFCHAAKLRNLANNKMIEIQNRQKLPLPQEIKTIKPKTPLPREIKNFKLKTPLPQEIKTIQQKTPLPHEIKKVEKAEPAEETVPKSGGQKRKKPPVGEPIHYGLRWKRKQSPENGIEYRAEHIVLKCKQGTNSFKQPICNLCKKPYDPNLMYLRCEKCLNWFHAESVELEESQVPDLVGFKCGKCRRKTQPRCPYVDNNNISMSNKKSKPNIVNSVHANNANPVHANTVNPVHANTGNLVHVKPSPPVLKPVEPVSLTKSNQKLSVRRAGQMSNDTNLQLNATDSEDLNDVSVSSELQWEDYSPEDFSFTAADADSNTGWIQMEPNVVTRDQEEDDDGFEPQTYFSFTELLEPQDNNNNNNNIAQFEDDNSRIGAVFDELLLAPDENTNNNNNQFEDSNNLIGAVFDELLSNSVQQEDNDTNVSVVCARCQVGEPAPDRICGNCGICIHTRCSPWIESDEPHQDGQWRCGDCRDWY